jgi:methyl-accepting chemotaxis protein
MNLLRDTKLSTRLIFSFAGILILLVVLSGMAMNIVSKIETSLTTINDVNSVKQRYAINFRGSVHDRAISLRDVTLFTSPADLDREIGVIAKLAEDYRKSADDLDKMFASRTDIMQEERTLLAAIKEIEAKALPGAQQVVDAQKAGKEADAEKILMDRVRPDFTEWLKRINAFIDWQEKRNSEIAKETRSTASNFQTTMLLVTGSMLIVGALLAWVTLRSLKPLSRVTRSMLVLAGGDTSAEIPEAVGKDEVGDIIRAVTVFKENLITNRELEAEAENNKRKAEEEKRRTMAEMAAQFEASVGSVVGLVSSAAAELERTARAMSGTIDDTKSLASTVASAATQTTVNMETVSTACSDMADSIRGIGQQVQQSSVITTRAVRNAEDTQNTAEGLVTATQRISDVVKLISDIASQTNLLALNATIEAARAGEAGKGFAVVASEVKNLASQTAKATDEITSQIAEVQEVSNRTVTAIRDIAGVIHESNRISASISQAVDHQNGATQEIARNVQQATSGTSEVSRAIVKVSEAANRGGSAADQVLNNAQELSRSAATLRQEVDRFLARIRAA